MSVRVDPVPYGSHGAIAQALRDERWPVAFFSDSLVVELQELLVLLFSPFRLLVAQTERGLMP